MRKHYPLNANGVEDAGRLPWTDGVPSTGTEGSYPGYAVVVDTESEVLAAQDAAGLVRNGQDQTQLGQAIARGPFLGGFGGSANALTAALPNSVTWPSLLPGMRFTAIASQPNTGSVTITLGGFSTVPGAISLLRRDGQFLQPGDIQPGLIFFIYDGSNFRVSIPVLSEISSRVTTVINSLKIVGGVPTIYAAAGVYSLPIVANTTFSIDECRGGGGGGGGASDLTSVGSGGGGGGNASKVLTTLTDVVLQITVGAAGAQGAAGGGNGIAGGTTSVVLQSGSVTDATGTTVLAGTTLCAATGGGPGRGAASGQLASIAGAGGVASGGDVNDNGDEGGLAQGPFANNTFIGGLGGISPKSGGSPQANQADGGHSSSSPGTGGNGSSANAPGGNGSPGRVIIRK